MAEINKFVLPGGTEITFEDTKARIISEATGNPVVIDGLQGGVPFNSVEVSGKNLLLGIVNLYPTTNGNLVANSNAISVYAKCNPNTTYTIQRNGGSRLQCAATQALPSNGTTFSNLIVAADQTASTITYTTPDNCNYIVVYLTGSSEEVTDIQIEEGSTPTAYEPPITGRELTIHACGKNLIPYPYYDTTKTVNGITFTDNGDGTITANGTATAAAIFTFSKRIALKNGTYSLSGCPKGGSTKTYAMQFAKSDWSLGIVDYGDGAAKQFAEDINFTQCRILISSGQTVENIIFRPQLELGSTATDFEKYSGAEYTITPDSNPYTVPNDIRQQDGLNTVSVSAGELTVNAVNKNSAVNKLWSAIDGIITTNANGDIILNY